jgi:hypothetical protein
MMEEVIIIRNNLGIEIFDNGAKIFVPFENKPILKQLNDVEISELYLNKTL